MAFGGFAGTEPDMFDAAVPVAFNDQAVRDKLAIGLKRDMVFETLDG